MAGLPIGRHRIRLGLPDWTMAQVDGEICESFPEEIMPNKVASANAGRTLWFHADRHRPGIAEFSR